MNSNTMNNNKIFELCGLRGAQLGRSAPKEALLNQVAEVAKALNISIERLIAVALRVELIDKSAVSTEHTVSAVLAESFKLSPEALVVLRQLCWAAVSPGTTWGDRDPSDLSPGKIKNDGLWHLREHLHEQEARAKFGVPDNVSVRCYIEGRPHGYTEDGKEFRYFVQASDDEQRLKQLEEARPALEKAHAELAEKNLIDETGALTQLVKNKLEQAGHIYLLPEEIEIHNLVRGYYFPEGDELPPTND